MRGGDDDAGCRVDECAQGAQTVAESDEFRRGVLEESAGTAEKLGDLLTWHAAKLQLCLPGKGAVVASGDDEDGSRVREVAAGYQQRAGLGRTRLNQRRLGGRIWRK